jgi:ribulose 1,5-bisphosphate synthetase/thiazole synthase
LAATIQTACHELPSGNAIAEASENNGASIYSNASTIGSSAFVMRNKPLHANRHMRVITVGAGASGIYMAWKLKHSFTDFTLNVYEKNPEVSGTW